MAFVSWVFDWVWTDLVEGEGKGLGGTKNLDVKVDVGANLPRYRAVVRRVVGDGSAVSLADAAVNQPDDVSFPEHPIGNHRFPMILFRFRSQS